MAEPEADARTLQFGKGARVAAAAAASPAAAPCSLLAVNHRRRFNPTCCISGSHHPRSPTMPPWPRAIAPRPALTPRRCAQGAGAGLCRATRGACCATGGEKPRAVQREGRERSPCPPSLPTYAPHALDVAGAWLPILPARCAVFNDESAVPLMISEVQLLLEKRKADSLEQGGSFGDEDAENALEKTLECVVRTKQHHRGRGRAGGGCRQAGGRAGGRAGRRLAAALRTSAHSPTQLPCAQRQRHQGRGACRFVF